MPRTVPALASEVPGNIVTGALWGTAQYAVGFLTTVPLFYGCQNTVQSVTNNTYTPLNIDTEIFDIDGGHSNVTNISRYTAQVPGTYLIIGTSGWAASATGTRRTRVTVNGATIKGGGTGYDVNQSVTSGGLAVGLAALNGTTDYVEVQGLQTSGGALNTVSASEFACSLAVLWVSA